MILVYTSHFTPALAYILKVFFGNKVRLTELIDEYTQFEGYKICYEKESIPGTDWHIIPHELMRRNNILQHKPCSFADEDWNENRLPIHNDIFALSFYIISRLEEYEATQFDKHGRFKPESSIIFRHGLRLPWIDIWRQLMEQRIQEKLPAFRSETGSYQNILSIDIDHAYLFKGKNKLRNYASLGKQYLLGNTEMGKLYAAYKNTGTDPYDTYMYIRNTCRDKHIKPYFFILTADYKKPYDTPISHRSPLFADLINNLRSFGKPGLHPGYESHLSIEKLAEEKQRLQSLIPGALYDTRQHFLKFRLPETYQRLETLGFKNDFSMGYASETGFRAGTSRPFHWFDCSKNAETSLTIYPLTCMDGTLAEYKKMSPHDAIQEIRFLKEQCKKYGGNFISLWHNHSLSETFHWKGWRAVFEESLL